MPFNKDGKRKPMMYGKKKPMMYGKKPMLTDLSGDGKVTKKDVMIGRDVPGFEKGMDKKAMMYGKKPKAYKPMKHKGPYMMKPGSREKDTPGSFREEVAPMYYGKKPMMFKPGKNPMYTGRDKILSEMSINRSLAGKAASGTKKRNMVGRSLESAGKVNVESSKPGVKIVEKAKPVSIPKPVKKQGESSFEDRARKAVGAPSRRAARKMKLR